MAPFNLGSCMNVEAIVVEAFEDERNAAAGSTTVSGSTHHDVVTTNVQEGASQDRSTNTGNRSQIRKFRLQLARLLPSLARLHDKPEVHIPPIEQSDMPISPQTAAPLAPTEVTSSRSGPSNVQTVQSVIADAQAPIVPSHANSSTASSSAVDVSYEPDIADQSSVVLQAPPAQPILQGNHLGRDRPDNATATDHDSDVAVQASQVSVDEDATLVDTAPSDVATAEHRIHDWRRALGQHRLMPPSHAPSDASVRTPITAVPSRYLASASSVQPTRDPSPAPSEDQLATLKARMNQTEIKLKKLPWDQVSDRPTILFHIFDDVVRELKMLGKDVSFDKVAGLKLNELKQGCKVHVGLLTWFEKGHMCLKNAERSAGDDRARHLSDAVTDFHRMFQFAGVVLEEVPSDRAATGDCAVPVSNVAGTAPIGSIAPADAHNPANTSRSRHAEQPGPSGTSGIGANGVHVTDNMPSRPPTPFELKQGQDAVNGLVLALSNSSRSPSRRVDGRGRRPWSMIEMPTQPVAA